MFLIAVKQKEKISHMDLCMAAVQFIEDLDQNSILVWNRKLLYNYRGSYRCILVMRD